MGGACPICRPSQCRFTTSLMQNGPGQSSSHYTKRAWPDFLSTRSGPCRLRDVLLTTCVGGVGVRSWMLLRTPTELASLLLFGCLLGFFVGLLLRLRSLLLGFRCFALVLF